jgi:hypothetical protein
MLLIIVLPARAQTPPPPTTYYAFLAFRANDKLDWQTPPTLLATALQVPAGEYGLQIVIKHPDKALIPAGYSLDPTVDWLALRAALTVSDKGEISKRLNMEGESGKVPDPTTHYPSDRTVWWSGEGETFHWAQRARPLLTPLWKDLAGTDPKRKGGEDADLLRRLLQPGLRETIKVKPTDGTETGYDLWRLHRIDTAADPSVPPPAERIQAFWGFWEPPRVWDAAHPVWVTELIGAIENAIAASMEKPWFSAARYGSTDPGDGQQKLVRHFAAIIKEAKTKLSASATVQEDQSAKDKAQTTTTTSDTATISDKKNETKTISDTKQDTKKYTEKAEVFSLSGLQWAAFFAIILVLALAGWFYASRLRKPDYPSWRDRLNKFDSETDYDDDPNHTTDHQPKRTSPGRNGLASRPVTGKVSNSTPSMLSVAAGRGDHHDGSREGATSGVALAQARQGNEINPFSSGDPGQPSLALEQLIKEVQQRQIDLKQRVIDLEKRMSGLEHLDARLNELDRLQLNNWQNTSKIIADTAADAAVDKVFDPVKRAIRELNKRLLALEATAQAVPDHATVSVNSHQPPSASTAPPTMAPEATPASPVVPAAPLTEDPTVRLLDALLSAGGITESQRATIEGFSVRDLGDLLTRIAGDYLPLERSSTEYERMAAAVRTATGGAYNLLVPLEGDKVNEADHRVASRRTVDKGAIGRVIAVVRPGVRSGETVLRPAEVVESA